MNKSGARGSGHGQVGFKALQRPKRSPNYCIKDGNVQRQLVMLMIVIMIDKKGEDYLILDFFLSSFQKGNFRPGPVLPFSLQRSQSGSFLCVAAPKVEQPVNGGWVGCKFPTHRGAFPSLGQFVLRLVKMGHIYGSVNGGWVGGVQISNTPRCVSS